MRTRFLGTDHFFSKSKDQILAKSLFTPLYLPAPDLFDPDPERGFGNPRFVACDEIILESDFGELSIDKALSDLFSDLIPQFCQVKVADQNALSEKELADFLYGESKDAGFREDASLFKIPNEWQLEKKLHFEIAELDIPQSEVVRFCKEEDCLELCFGVPKIKVPLDIIELDVKIAIPYKEELLESLYNVEKVPFEIDHAESYSKNGTSYTDVALNYIPKVPQFELRDVDWDQDYEKPIAKTETYNSLLSVMELCSGDHEQELALSLKELLPSPNLDTLSYICKEPEYESCDEPGILPLNSVLEMDLICFNDKILVDKRSAIYLLNPDGTHSDLPCAVLLPKVEMMDFTSNNNSKIFSDLKPTELDTSEVLLTDHTNQAMEFYESIVSSELALVDETFQSLPTPVLSDDKLNKPPSAFVQELLCSMEPHSFPASDGIYLDWHLLIKGTCEREICSRYKTMVEDVNAITLTAEKENFPEEGAMVDIIDLLEGSQGKVSTQHCKEVLSETHFGVSNSENRNDHPRHVSWTKEERAQVQKQENSHDHPRHVSWTKEEKAQVQKQENSHDHPRHVSWTKEEKAQVQKQENSGNKSKEAVPATSSGKASMLFESMSQNSDLNFFLGSRRGVARREGTVDGNSRKESCISTEKITMSKEPAKPAAVLVEPTPLFTVLKEPTKPDILKEPLMKARNLFHDPNNKSSEETAIYLQNLLPAKEKSNSSSFEPANANPAVNIPSFISSRTPGSTKPPFPGVVVVVNTQCLNKPMLVSRRSSYQKILALEKEGAHVVERDINLPLDLIFSAGVCLVWYETAAFGNSSRNMTDGASCIQMFMENIATNVLISLSYSFSSCVMIFEGEANLLGVIMGQSDTLYSAAANLDFNLQLLCSYNPESTDEIILTCITKFTSPTRGLYPPMPESETLAEYFLTKFPSINPLSAHAILSTGGALINFLEWSNERRIQAIGKYLVPDESIALFSALCRYGEMGESKSVMTDCSSVESDINSSLLQPPPKRKRFANEFVDVPMGDTFFSKPFEQFQSDFMEPHVDNQLKKSVSTIIDEFVGRKKGIISCAPSDCDEVEADQAQLLDPAFNEKMTHPRIVFDQEQAFMSEVSSFSPRPESRSKLPVKSSLPTIGLEFSDYSFRTFPTSAEMEDESTSNWVSQKMKCVKDGTGLFGVQGNVLRADDQESKYSGISSKQCPGWKFEFLGGGGQKRSLSSSNSSSKESHCKIRSPSIIDSYRYQGSKESAKRIDKYRYPSKGKDAINPLRPKWKDFKLQQTPIPTTEKRKTSAPLNPSLTPVDKRARQNLSFTRNGKEKQSKLVWRRKDSPCISTSLGKRSREEGHFHNL